MAEPGDKVAGRLVGALGASGALAALVDRAEPDRIAAMAGPGALRAEEIEAGIERWSPRLASGPALVALRQAVRLGIRLSIPGDDYWIAGVDDLGDSAPLALWLRGQQPAITALGRSYW